MPSQTEVLTEVWQLQLLGPVVLRGPNGNVRLPRSTCVALAYLALEGRTSKYRLAAWLWPDSSEESVKANMRKLLQRLRSSTGTDLVVGDEQISLRDDVLVDAMRLSALSFAGEYAAASRPDGALLEGLEFDDCPELQEWLLATRESLAALRRDAALAESERLKANSRFADALVFARRALEFEVVSEESHRRVMCLHYLAGDRGAALAAFFNQPSVTSSRKRYGGTPGSSIN
jgi:DNA-binding SARP family transcriptional activator